MDNMNSEGQNPLSQQNPSPPSQPSVNSKSVLIGVGIGLAIGAVALAGLFVWQINSDGMKQVADTSVMQDDGMVKDDAMMEDKDTVEIVLDDYTQVSAGWNGELIKDYTENLYNRELDIQWLKGAVPLTEQETANLLGRIEPEVKRLFENRQSECARLKSLEEYEFQSDLPDYCNTYVYRAGTVVEPFERDVYHVFTYFEELGSGWTHNVVLYEPSLNSFVQLVTDQYTGYIPMMLQPYLDGILVTQSIVIDYPEYIEIPGQKSRLKFEKYLEKSGTGPFNRTASYENYGGILDVREREIVRPYHEDTIAFLTEENQPVFFKDEGYHLFLEDGSVAIYDLEPYFFMDSDEPDAEKDFYSVGHLLDITFNDPKHGKETFELAGDISTVACGVGIVPCTNIVDDKYWFNEAERVEVGRTSMGEPVYELANNGRNVNEYYREMFDYGFDGYVALSSNPEAYENMPEDEKLAEFLGDVPIIFWKDHNDRWRVYKKTKYTTLAECGKPVIYLYPEEDQEVNVQVKPNRGFTITDPIYPEGGWNVWARTNGVLTSLDNGNEYPYLFWEGHGYDYVRPDYGFVFTRDEVGQEVRSILGKLGLIEQEVEDFMDFWQPKLEEKEYVFITFLEQEKFEEMAPLTVSPQPDTVIRVFMDYEPLDSPVDVREPRIITPEREGFTVVEWGGALR